MTSDRNSALSTFIESRLLHLLGAQFQIASMMSLTHTRPLLRLAQQIRNTQSASFARLNIFKDPAQGPEERPDTEYPAWLWRLGVPEATKEELVREADAHFQQGGYDRVFECMTEKQLQRLFRLERRERIKFENGRRRGGKVV